MTSVALDSNLLLLLVVGRVSRRRVEKHKRLSAFKAADFDLLMRLVAAFDELIICPNVMTETSNLLRHGDDRDGTLTAALALVAETCCELHVESRVAARRPEFARLGLTDAVLLTLAESGATLLTADVALHLAALRAEHQSLNFNHVTKR